MVRGHFYCTLPFFYPSNFFHARTIATSADHCVPAPPGGDLGERGRDEQLSPAGRARSGTRDGRQLTHSRLPNGFRSASSAALAA